LARQRGHMPVRKLMQGLPTLLPKLKPCLLMSPLSVAQYLAAGHSQFDVVVFDEASQIAVWDAVGVIARGKQLVVVGDPKQLPPTNFFGRSSTDGDDGGDGQQVEDLESILDECLGAGMNRLTLKWHYRSRHESLIAFSNVNYYESELVTFPSPVTSDVAVRFQPVAGIYDRGGSRTNRAEAEAIVDAIEKHYLKEGSAGLTMGVVTFNQTQQSLIATLLEARRRSNSQLDKVLAQKVSEELFIKNLENVQGDERDIILFSITYGPDAAGKVTMNFGPLNSEGGHRRLNVAISRARHGIVIYSTLKPEQIDLARVRAAGVRDLKHYLEFAQRGPRALVEQAVPTGLTPDSPFEAAVIGLLRDKGWVVHPQVGCSGYRVDIGVVDPRAPGRYLLGVECDGATYHSAATARDRDRLRQHVLESLGWRIHRIWSTDWWLDPQRELEKLVSKLEELVNQDPDELVDETEVAEAELLAPIEEMPEADPVPEVTPNENPLKQYSTAVLPLGVTDDFYEPSATSKLHDHIAQVVNLEGPILEGVLYKRVARAWGLERTGSRIVDRLKSLAHQRFAKTVDGDKTFFWPVEANPAEWRDFRVSSGDANSRRHIDEVALEEVGAVMQYILHQAGGTSCQELARTTCRMLGMNRVAADAEARAMLAVAQLAERGRVVVEGDQVRAMQ
jgi:very-short-patch-repair endonuclease